MNRTVNICLICCCAVIEILIAGPVSAQSDAYDPLAVSDLAGPECYATDSPSSLAVKLDLTKVRNRAEESPAAPKIMHITMI